MARLLVEWLRRPYEGCGADPTFRHAWRSFAAALRHRDVHERYGLVMQPDDKDAALLPRRIKGRFAVLHRPWTDPCADIWISFSPDLRNCDGHRQMLTARQGLE